MERRRFLALAAGISTLSGGETVVPRESRSGSDSDGTIRGTVTDLGGTLLEDASVDALGVDDAVLADATTDGEGRFTLAAGPSPVWLRVGHPEHLSRVVAVEPGRHTVRLTPAEETVSLTFGGDTMFGRRFYAERSGRDASPLIDVDAPLAGHREVLSHVAPVLRNADVASLNLETPLTTSEWRHPEKAYTFTSHPAAATALAGAGVDHVALANNHAFDALSPGLADTTTALEGADVRFSGAGRSSDQAWKPAYLDRNGVRIALVSCATEVGRRYDVDWSADRDTSKTHTVTQEVPGGGRERLRFPGSVGVAEASGRFMVDRIRRARDAADVVVVHIHGGEQYRRTPPEWLVDRVDLAVDLGADVVVTHHPHVTGGLEMRDGALVAWSLGNLVFDQELWETYRSHLLTVHVTGDGVRRAHVHPVLLDRYVPKGVTGTARRRLLRETAGRSSVEFSLADGNLTFTGEGPDRRRVTRTLTGEDDVYVRRSGWVEGVEGSTGSVRLGVDRLVAGDFDDSVVDGERPGVPLWRIGGDRYETGSGVGYGGSGGVGLSPAAGDDEPSTLGPGGRVPVHGEEVTLTGLYRTGGTADLRVRIRWYDGLDVRSGLPASREPFRTEAVGVAGTEGDWERATVSLRPPDGATHVDVRLEPPDGETGRAWFDDWRLIDWTDGATGGRAFDHLRVDGSATVRFVVEGGTTDDGVVWERLGSQGP